MRTAHSQLRRTRKRNTLAAKPPRAWLIAVTFSLSHFLTFMPAAAQEVDDGRPAALRGVGIEQRLDQQVPLDLVFRDEEGREVRLAEYFGERPVVLALVYYRCPMLCNLLLEGLVRSLRTVKFDAGGDFDVVVVSFDPRETPDLAKATKKTVLERYQRPGAQAGWHFLTGDEESIGPLTEAVGFRYRWDEATQEYAHAAAVMVLTPQGRLARYFFGIEYPARDLQFGLMEAAENRIGSRVDQVLLFCYHWDPATGTYGLAIMNLVRVVGLLTVAGIVLFISSSLWRERRRGPRTGPPADDPPGSEVAP
jgi:protein SCO1